MIMKLVYFFIFLFGLFLSGYLFLNDFNFDNVTFSGYLINTLFVLVLTSVFVAVTSAVLYMVSQKKRSSYYKDVMTIRQYYDYKA